MSILDKLLNLVRSRRKSSGRKLYDSGFHGDKYLLKLVDSIAYDCEYFVETGANVGSTLKYTSEKYGHMKCFSCEPDNMAYKKSLHNTNHLKNVHIFNEGAKSFLSRLGEEYSFALSGKSLLWIDAHGCGFEWPLQYEVDFVSRNFQHGYMLIDDFRVPHIDRFSYDAYEGQECSFDYIQGCISEDWSYQLYYPDYMEQTSSYHPLRGWGLFTFGDMRDKIPDEVSSFVRAKSEISEQ